MLSKTVPSVSLPSYSTTTVEALPGETPPPFLITLYCNPSGSVFTPGFFAFSFRNFSPSILLFSAAALFSSVAFFAASISLCIMAFPARAVCFAMASSSVLPMLLTVVLIASLILLQVSISCSGESAGCLHTVMYFLANLLSFPSIWLSGLATAAASIVS